MAREGFMAGSDDWSKKGRSDATKNDSPGGLATLSYFELFTGCSPLRVVDGQIRGHNIWVSLENASIGFSARKWEKFVVFRHGGTSPRQEAFSPAKTAPDRICRARRTGRPPARGPASLRVRRVPSPTTSALYPWFRDKPREPPKYKAAAISRSPPPLREERIQR